MNKVSLETFTKKYPIIPSKELIHIMQSIIEPYLKEREEEFTLPGPIHGSIYKADRSKGTIMVSHGFTESTRKYKELIYYFLQEGYNVCIHDHRNHGYSRKAAQDRTHIDSYKDYLSDFDQVVNQKLKTCPEPYYLFCHSMGGMIGTNYVESHPIFKKVVLSSPMLEVNRGGIPYFAAKTMASVACAVKKGNALLPGQGSFNAQEDFENSASSCYERYKVYFDQQVQDEFLQSGGPTYSWTNEAFKGCKNILKKCENIKVPVLLFQADKDDFVLPGGQEQFISKIKDGQIIFIPTSKHEIYLSEDFVVEKYIQVIFDFLAK